MVVNNVEMKGWLCQVRRSLVGGRMGRRVVEGFYIESVIFAIIIKQFIF